MGGVQGTHRTGCMEMDELGKHDTNINYCERKYFAVYIFLRNSRFLDIHENMYTSKFTFIIAYRANYT